MTKVRQNSKKLDEDVLNKISKLEQKLMKVYKMEYTKYKSSFQIRKAKNIQLQKIGVDIQESFDTACKGHAPLQDIKVPPELDIDTFYEILLESKKNFIAKLLQTVESYMDKHEVIGSSNTKLVEELRSMGIKKFQMESMVRRKIGTSDDEDHPLGIYIKAFEYFCKRDSRMYDIVKRINR